MLDSNTQTPVPRWTNGGSVRSALVGHNGPAAEPAAATDVEVSSVQASLAAEAPANPVAVPVPVDRTPCPRCRFDNPAGATSCGRCHLNSFPRPRMAAVVTEASHDPGPAKPPAVPAAVPVDTTVAVPVAVPVRQDATRTPVPALPRPQPGWRDVVRRVLSTPDLVADAQWCPGWRSWVRALHYGHAAHDRGPERGHPAAARVPRALRASSRRFREPHAGTAALSSMCNKTKHGTRH